MPGRAFEFKGQSRTPLPILPIPRALTWNRKGALLGPCFSVLWAMCSGEAQASCVKVCAGYGGRRSHTMLQSESVLNYGDLPGGNNPVYPLGQGVSLQKCIPKQHFSSMFFNFEDRSSGPKDLKDSILDAFPPGFFVIPPFLFWCFLPCFFVSGFNVYSAGLKLGMTFWTLWVPICDT